MKLLAALFAATVALAQAPAKQAPKPAAEAKPKTDAKADAKASAFVGNKDSKVLHKGDCKTAVAMKPANRLAFASREEAEKQGFKPCKVCLK